MIADIKTGLVTGTDEIFIKPRAEWKRYTFEQDVMREIVMGDEITKWYIESVENFCIYNSYFNKTKNKTEIMPLEEMKKHYPNVSTFLESKKDILLERKDGRKQLRNGREWWGLMRFGSLELLNKKKIFLKVPSKHVTFGLDENKRCSIVRVPYITPKDNELLDIYYLLGFLNSKLSDFYFRLNCPIKRGGYFEITVTKIKKIPFILPEDNINQRISALVKEIIEAVKEINKLISSTKLWYKVNFSTEISLSPISNKDDFINKNREILKRIKAENLQSAIDKVAGVIQKIHNFRKKIETIEGEIDNLIYRIYGLTEKEIQIIEHVCNVWKVKL